MAGTILRGALVSVCAIGVLIRGPSGSGKSNAALNLMRRGHFLVADELVEVAPGPLGQPTGMAVDQHVWIEVRGLGIFKAESLFPGATTGSAPINMIVDLDEYVASRDAGRTAPETGETDILDRSILTVHLPVPRGVDPSLAIELLARLYKETGSVRPQ